MTRLLTFIFILLNADGAFAWEFQHFALKNELREIHAIQSGASVSGTRSSMGALGASDAAAAEKELRRLVAAKLLDLKPGQAYGAKSFSSEDESVPPLLEKIAQVLSDNYAAIGREQTAPLALNHDMGGGILNFSGFVWQKPFANFQLYVNRQLAPDLFSDGWIVRDTLTIGVDASTLLNNMRDADLINIAEETIGAFAGVSFTREYHYYHFASTFLEGLQSDYSKLFLTFAKFTPSNALELPPYHIMKKKDKFSFNAGGMVNWPPTGGASLRAGALISVAHEKNLTLQAVGPSDSPKEGEFLRLGLESKTNKSIGAHLSLQADFFNLLKLTLLSYDLEYEYGKSNQTHLSFRESDKVVVRESRRHFREFERLVSGKSDQVAAFKQNIVQLDERINENLNSKYTVLLMGSVKKRETEQIKIVKAGVEKIFFKHYSESVKFIQNLWSRIFGIVTRKLFDWDSPIDNAAEIKKRLAVEFEHMEDLGEARVIGEDKFSVTLTHTFQAAQTHRWWHGLYRRESSRHLGSMTNLSSAYRGMVEDKKLRGPLEVATKIQIHSKGLRAFNFMDENDAFKLFNEICNKDSACKKLLKRKYTDYTAHFHRYGIVDLMRFKSFMGSYFKRARSYRDIYSLFGQENVFMNGSFTAVTNKGAPFATYFKEGEFQGVGVIDTFMREGVSRAPASISAK